jgi:hypothetical protein
MMLDVFTQHCDLRLADLCDGMLLAFTIELGITRLSDLIGVRLLATTRYSGAAWRVPLLGDARLTMDRLLLT